MTIIEDIGVTTYNHGATMGFNRGKVSLHCNTQNTEDRHPNDHPCGPTQPPSHPATQPPSHPATQPAILSTQPASHPIHPASQSAILSRAPLSATESPLGGQLLHPHHNNKKLQHNCEGQGSPEEEHRNDKLNISSLDIVPQTLAFYLLYCLEIFRILKVVDTASTRGLKLGKLQCKSNFNRIV